MWSSNDEAESVIVMLFFSAFSLLLLTKSKRALADCFCILCIEPLRSKALPTMAYLLISGRVLVVRFTAPRQESLMFWDILIINIVYIMIIIYSFLFKL